MTWQARLHRAIQLYHRACWWLVLRLLRTAKVIFVLQAILAIRFGVEKISP